MKPLHPRDYAALKTAFRRLVDKIGGVEAAASYCRVHFSKIAEYYSPNHPLRFVPADVIADLEAAAEEPIVTRELARIAGYTMTPFDASGDPMHSALGAALRESAEAAACGLDALGDGVVSDDEAAIIGAHAADSVRRWSLVAAIAGRKIGGGAA